MKYINKKILLLILISISFMAYSRIAVEPQQAYVYNVVQQKAEYSEYTEADVSPISRVEYAEYERKIVEYISKADSENLYAAIIKMINDIGTEKANMIIVDALDKIENVKQMSVFIEALEKVNAENKTSVDIVNIMELVMQKIYKIDPSAYKSLSADRQKDANIKWYETSEDYGTGIWAIIVKARYKAERGEDVSELYKLFRDIVNCEISK